MVAARFSSKVMGSGAVETNRFTNVEAENSRRKQPSQAPARDDLVTDANDAVADPDDAVSVCWNLIFVKIVAS